MESLSLFMTQILKRCFKNKTQSNVFENLKLKHPNVFSRKRLILNVSWCVYRLPFKI